MPGRSLLAGSFFALAACSAPITAPRRDAPALGPADGLRAPLDTWEDIHPFLVFDNRIDYGPRGSFAQRRYDAVWSAGHVVEPRRGSRDALITFYLPYNRDPRGYNPAFDERDHTISWYRRHHPEWVVYTCPRGVEPVDPATAIPAYYMDENGDHLVPLDVSNPEVVAWQLERWGRYVSRVLVPEGYDAVGFDNVHLANYFGFCGVFVGGRFVRRYHPENPTEPRWCADIAEWASHLSTGLHALSPPLRLMANITPLEETDPECLRSVIDHLDGVAFEGGFTRADWRPLSERGWVARVRAIVDIQRAGRAIYTISQVPDLPPVGDFCARVVGRSQMQWALASYLMSKEHASSIFVSGLQQYGCSLWYPEYDVSVGHPCGLMRRQAGAWVRDYSRGLVLVNAGEQRVALTLPAGAALDDLYGAPAGSPQVLAPRTGAVLVAPRGAPPRCP